MDTTDVSLKVFLYLLSCMQDPADTKVSGHGVVDEAVIMTRRDRAVQVLSDALHVERQDPASGVRKLADQLGRMEEFVDRAWVLRRTVEAVSDDDGAAVLG